jgi:AcrR family transcriptional regulator
MTEPFHPSQVPRSLPRGRSHLPREVVLVSQRERLLEATVEVVGSKGYAATSVADIIKAARVSRTTFYEQFHDKEQCFRAAYEEGARAHLEHVRTTAAQATGSMQCLQAGIRAYLDVLAGEPAFARVVLVEVLAAGPAAAASRDWALGRYAELLRNWHAEARRENSAVPPMPGEVFDCAAGGVSDYLATVVREGNAERLPALAPVLVTFLLNAGGVPAGRDLAAALAATRTRRQ